MSFFDTLSVILLNEEVLALHDWLCPKRINFRVKRMKLGFWFVWSVRNGKLDSCILPDGSVATDLWIKYLLVDGPDLVPFHQVVVAGRSLLKHEVAKSLGCHSSALNTLHSWESGIVPSVNMTFLDKPTELSLGKDCALQVQ